MCFGGGKTPKIPKPTPAPVSAESAVKRNNLESKARRSFASTVLGESNRGQQQRIGELKTLLGS